LAAFAGFAGFPSASHIPQTIVTT